MKIYQYDDLPGDQRLPHDSGISITPEYLSTLGVLSFHFTDTDSHPALDAVNNLATTRGYKNRDVITVSPLALGALYPEKVKSFFREHLHEDEEIRFILDGAGYFDVRDDLEGGGGEKPGRWVRVAVEKGDLLILPAGIYHRFTSGEGDYIVAMRLFKEEPVWTALERERGEVVEKNRFRVGYLERLVKGELGV